VTRRSLAWMAALFAVLVAADQWVKHLVETRLPLQEVVDVLPFIALYRTYNTGVAFSMFSWMGDTGLILLSLSVIAFVLFLTYRTSHWQVISRIGFTLIIGGAVGNLIDRAVYGHVIDYVLFHTPVWSFAIFNLADAFITIGAGLVLLEEFLGWRRGPVVTPND
jgi:signal peptidase II